ncbi:hypothetical protein H4W29_006718 [Rhizobium viscosum]|uniref:Transposase n=1 Tax=Rhizobium viscosum TaxID=1673 RepID=A0ABR9J1W4_RHIVS|nr:hypothetical protein [Rhizobium viscosum]
MLWTGRASLVPGRIRKTFLAHINAFGMASFLVNAANTFIR